MLDEIVSDTSTDAESAAEKEEVLRCDFCGEPSASVRRVALDRDYDRLQKRHKAQYACDACSDKKETERLGI